MAVNVPTTGQSLSSINTNQHGTADSITKPWTNVNTSGFASTTGNITGIYDMSGGTWDFVMAVYNGYSGKCNSSNSGFNGRYGTPSATGCNGTLTKTDGIDFPHVKYYSSYSSTDKSMACNGAKCYGSALSETAGWYSDYNVFVSAAGPWNIRGGFYRYGIEAGLFASNSYYGDANDGVSFRTVIGL